RSSTSSTRKNASRGKPITTAAAAIPPQSTNAGITPMLALIATSAPIATRRTTILVFVRSRRLGGFFAAELAAARLLVEGCGLNEEPADESVQVLTSVLAGPAQETTAKVLSKRA